MRLILARHGETDQNVKHIIQGQTNTSLNQRGLEQARKLGHWLKDEDIHHIYASDLKRAADTARAIQVHHPHLEIVFTPQLRERHFGELEGKSFEYVKQLQKKLHATNLITTVGEPLQDMCTRAEHFFQSLFPKHMDDTVLVIAHGLFNRGVIAAIEGKSFQEIETIERLHNTSVCIYQFDKRRKVNVVCFNSVEHLG
ncbi:histidine phosphatase family protein [Candidatus Woesebacteria bacterium]|nr:histidine phosphatase family protein [Candidatus Woesebacteria bacterium]